MAKKGNSAMKGDVWYVSYRSNIAPKHDDEQRAILGTRRFEAEAEAKQFADDVVRMGWSAMAGTINPHRPKKTIASTKILDWIAGKE
jgi:hypothetical protein